MRSQKIINNTFTVAEVKRNVVWDFVMKNTFTTSNMKLQMTKYKFYVFQYLFE